MTEPHPYHEQIAAYLKSTVKAIQHRLQDLNPPIAYAGDRAAQRVISAIQLEEIERLKDAARSAFFARVDWNDPKEGEDTIYIGRAAPLGIANLVSWAAPLAQRLYEDPGNRTDGHQVNIVLNVDVSGTTIGAIHNKYVDPKISTTLVQAQFTDSLLFKIVQGGHKKLREIVATIQRHQYTVIKRPKDALLIVQGAPGSGKTSIALHRITYLLYNHKELKPENMLVLVPNKLFLRHIDQILPSLGNRTVPQKTFDQWIIEVLGEDIRYDRLEQSLEMLLDTERNPSERAMLYRNAYNKGSLQMARLIDRRLEQLYAEQMAAISHFECAYRPHSSIRRREIITVRYDRAKLQQLMQLVKEQPYNKRRDIVEQALSRDLTGDIYAQIEKIQPQVSRSDDSQLRADVRKFVEKQVRDYLAQWVKLNARVVYRQIIRSAPQLGKGIFSAEDLELLLADAPTQLTPFRFSDLAGLLYLKLQLDGIPRLYDHIVIDEAQDITPLHVHILTRCTTPGALTMVGDISQGIYAHHGIDSWESLAVATGTAACQPEVFIESYRSTKSIISFANALLTRIGVPSTQLAIPVDRDGPAPKKHPATDARQRATAIRQSIMTIRTKQADATIAIIAKTSPACRALATELAATTGEPITLILNHDDRFDEGSAIFPIYLTKGMEFDAVIIADADSATYPPDMLHARLLFVALTRAAHFLFIHWIGTGTALIDAQHRQLPLQPLLGGILAPRPMTIAEFVTEHPTVSRDRVVERLARADKLPLFATGRLDHTVIDALLHFNHRLTDTAAANESGVVQRLDSSVQESLRHQLLPLDHDPAQQSAIALLELTYGLLRNQLRAAGFELGDDQVVALDEATTLLASLAVAIRTGRFMPNAGRWTTRQAVLQHVDAARRTIAAHWLDELIQRGIVGERMGSRTELRLDQQWVPSLLAHSLGELVGDWDDDLGAKLPRLPRPLVWAAQSAEGQ